MSLKGKIVGAALLGFIKWVLILIIAAILYYYISPKYEYLSNGKIFNRITGEIEND